MPVSPLVVDRAAGCLLGEACGDALGVPYEMAAPPVGEAVMKGGGLGPYDPGEWSDDTQMTLCVATAAAAGLDLTGPDGLDAVAEAFVAWLAGGATDVGLQTRTVLLDAASLTGRPHEQLTAAAEALHARTGHTAGNGALMRTSVVGLFALDDREKTAAAARAVARLTHADDLASDSSVLCSEAIRVAVTEGRLDLTAGLDLVADGNRESWAGWLEEATGADPGQFQNNGFTVTALQAAWAAITTTDRGDGSAMHVQRGLQAAVRAGHDTDTVAAVAGSLLGARYGASAIPTQWRRMVHGWPGYRAHDLVEIAVSTVRGGRRPGEWPSVATMVDPDVPSLALPHPIDPDILLGSISDLRRARELGVQAVVSLCPLGLDDVPAEGMSPRDHIEFWFNGDAGDADANPHLDFVLDDASSALRQFRAEGKRVLLHCHTGSSRAPAVALRYAVDLGVAPELAQTSIRSAVPDVRAEGRLWEVAAHGE
ncbi:ADP-ribosylglycohydrolase family protein [Terracoccus luteus]|uniref:ADP-ribosylglycohydrolase n=1 Tax=Terracoccus luteus TaxID=53356 RepID=A0A839PWK3_9MICO|nr:ADP-ribosylglycohydrolase family protein [Terracoccus luteus]MBB2987104.1 ADP-ribosylglycohydrolase [Terracoccus luteus]MCP2172755.1 ADP-ribosylglycohydrolase [Terracoccus luteus]